jgi:short chain dehydrogenase
MKHTHGRPMAGRTVLVTGATSGIGRATALGLATMGAHIAITGRDRGRTEDVAREIRASEGLSVDAFVADLSSQAQVRRLASEVLDGAQRLLVPFLRPLMKSPTQGAATSIHLASSPELEQVSGRYFRQPATNKILRTQLRPGGRGTALGGERGSGQTYRGTRV